MEIREVKRIRMQYERCEQAVQLYRGQMAHLIRIGAPQSEIAEASKMLSAVGARADTKYSEYLAVKTISNQAFVLANSTLESVMKRNN